MPPHHDTLGPAGPSRSGCHGDPLASGDRTPAASAGDAAGRGWPPSYRTRTTERRGPPGGAALAMGPDGVDPG